MKTIELRRAIHARERGRCFYCLRRVASRLECLDHVVPRARVGCNSYRNLVSACMECNAQKGERPAEEYLRWLFREHRLGAAELRGRFEALEMLAAGKLRPAVASEEGGGSALVEARFLDLGTKGITQALRQRDLQEITRSAAALLPSSGFEALR